MFMIIGIFEQVLKDLITDQKFEKLKVDFAKSDENILRLSTSIHGV